MLFIKAMIARVRINPVFLLSAPARAIKTTIIAPDKNPDTLKYRSHIL
jgi:hypothetical protein